MTAEQDQGNTAYDVLELRAEVSSAIHLPALAQPLSAWPACGRTLRPAHAR